MNNINDHINVISYALSNETKSKSVTISVFEVQAKTSYQLAIKYRKLR